MSEPMRVVVADRQQGKTTALLKWLQEGHEIPTYPGWSRVLIVSSAQEETRLSLGDGGPWEKWRKCIWGSGGAGYAVKCSVVPGTVEYAVDNLDHFIQRGIGLSVTPVLVSISGVVEPVSGSERDA